jgi:glycosyltransferase involved in cell wall biosynthesis
VVEGGILGEEEQALYDEQWHSECHFPERATAHTNLKPMTQQRKRALVLSAYDADSHRRWRLGLEAALGEAFDWTHMTLPPRHFAWRARGSALTWAMGPEREVLERGWDVVVATSTVDLSALRGLVPALARARAVVYFHENQFAYPMRGQAARNALHLQLHDVYTALAADRVLFNSAHNRDTMLGGARALLGKLPDGVPPGVVESIAARSRVVPVGIDDGLSAPRERAPGPLRIVWNHRWEYDKAPEAFVRACELLVGRGVEVEVAILGRRFRTIPGALARAEETLADVLTAYGRLERRADYVEALRRADVVVSTAIHEFQGLAVLEAMACGCHAVTPDRLAYREYVPEACRYASTPGDAEAEASALAGALEARVWEGSPGADVSGYRWGALAARYADELGNHTTGGDT